MNDHKPRHGPRGVEYWVDEEWILDPTPDMHTHITVKQKKPKWLITEEEQNVS